MSHASLSTRGPNWPRLARATRVRSDAVRSTSARAGSSSVSSAFTRPGGRRRRAASAVAVNTALAAASSPAGSGTSDRRAYGARSVPSWRQAKMMCTVAWRSRASRIVQRTAAAEAAVPCTPSPTRPRPDGRTTPSQAARPIYGKPAALALQWEAGGGAFAVQGRFLTGRSCQRTDVTKLPVPAGPTALITCIRRIDAGALYMASSSWAATMTTGQCACRRHARATGPMASGGWPAG